MSIRRLTSVLLFLGALLPAIFGGEIGPFTGPEADAEAARLYEHANDYVNNVVEGLYSYSYIQFHWKRAGSNIDRILRAYPSSPTAHQIQAGTLKVGPFAPSYYKERVLPRLEEKKVGAFDAINCAIFLYNLENNKDEPARKELLAQIVSTLCRQQRWGEALGYPVADADRAWLWQLVTRVATVYHNDKLVGELVGNTENENLRLLRTTQAEALAFRGDTSAELEAFAKEHAGQSYVRPAIFAGLLRREIRIQRARQLKLPLNGLYDGVDVIQKPAQSADLLAFLNTIPPGADQTKARRDYARFLAATGRIDEARSFIAPAEQASLAADYAGYLVAIEEYQKAVALPETFQLSASEAAQFRLQLVELLAQAGRQADAATIRTQIPATLLAQAEYQEWRGRILSIQEQLVVREHTFAEIPLTDPNLLGRLICEWSLTPNRTLRGAAPWDAVIFKFAPGYNNLPPPKDKNKVEAAGR
jgi:hypothetical protein